MASIEFTRLGLSAGAAEAADQALDETASIVESGAASEMFDIVLSVCQGMHAVAAEGVDVCRDPRIWAVVAGRVSPLASTAFSCSVSPTQLQEFYRIYAAGRPLPEPKEEASPRLLAG
jgi:hypothetical protein